MEVVKTIGIGTFIVGALLGLTVFGMWGCPRYSVWQQGLAGEAELKRAEWNRQIAVKEAQAKKEAAISLAQAEVERAKGVAEANKIIGESLQNNHDYLMWLWIEGLKDAGTHEKIIYVPTEAGLPILEAGRFQQQPEVAAGDH